MKDPNLFPLDSIERYLYNKFTTDYRMNKYSKEEVFDLCEFFAESVEVIQHDQSEVEDLRSQNKYLREALEEIERIARYGL